MSLLRELEAEDGLPSVRVHGRLTNAEYQTLVKASHVGLALKPASGPLANTTFPSKIVELASSGLLVLTTDISDVRRVLGEGGLYLENQTVASLIERLRWIVDHRQEAARLASKGTIAVWQQCSPAVASRKLTQFLFEARV
jgi:glycosyltransferase involved in cell wall biosynthesis